MGLTDSRAPLLLMVSGGSDSVALLLLTNSLCNNATASDSKGPSSAKNTHPLHVLHVNHMLRGTESDADERFVVELCNSLKVACTVKHADIAAAAANTGEGIEQTGRRLRYELAESTLKEFASALNGKPTDGYILTAHTADDRAETLLQRLIVGGGSGSLASIPKRNGKVVRPVLNCTRQELRSWLTLQNKNVNGCLWREDATNLDTHHSRAFVRHEILPLLTERNPRIVEGLNRTADVLSDESAWMDSLASELLPLSAASFTAPLPLLRRAIYLACNEAIAKIAPEARITFEHIEQIASSGGKAGFACQIPGGIEVRVVKGDFQFKKAKPPQHDPRAR